MTTLYETQKNGKGSFYNAKYVEHNGRKFRFICETRNGDPIGFKSNKCLQVMATDGTFANVVDCNMVGINYQNDYFHTATEEENYKTMLFKAFETFIKKVY